VRPVNGGEETEKEFERSRVRKSLSGSVRWERGLLHVLSVWEADVFDLPPK
jgi:hypothetical protein